MSHTIGIVADNPAAMARLRIMMTELGQTVAYGLTADQVWESAPLIPSLWIVISEQAADVFDTLSDWSDAQILLADDFPPEEDKIHTNQWCTSLCEKVFKILELPGIDEVSHPRRNIKEHQAFKDVWVLAASLGGPEAVRVFLANVDPDLPITFVYAQHIEPTFDRMLPSVIGKDSQFEVNFCTDGEMLRKGSLVVFPSHTFASVDDRGRMWVQEGKEWDKPYTPNIDQVIRNVADYYQDRMGIIIFSGMCDDGSATSIELKGQGVPLWAQNPKDCICPAMPEAVINKKAVNYIGTAVELAKHLNNRYGKVNTNGNVAANEKNIGDDNA